MAYTAKKENTEYKRLISDIKAGQAGQLYVFFGEESYLKSHYISRLRQLLCGDFDEFNYVFLEGERLTQDALEDAVYTLPMGGGRKLVVVRDYKLMQPAGGLKDMLPEVFSQLPEYVCLVFYFESLEFKADKRLSIYKTLDKHGSIVEFERASSADLIPWLKRRFQGLGKAIETRDCEHMLFLCGYSMTNLITEVEKIAAATLGEKVSRGDIDALASRVLEADVFELTNAVADKNYTRAIGILGDLFDMRNEAVAILAAITKQLQRMYGARLAFEAKKGEAYVMELAGFRSSYPARLLLDSARKVGLKYLRAAQHKCLECDVLLKSNLSDDRRTLELLLLQLSQEVMAQ